MAREKNTTVIFLGVTFVVSALCYWVYFVVGESAAPAAALLMFCPSLVALALKLVYYRKERVLGFERSGVGFIMLAIFLPVFYLGVSYGIFRMIIPAPLTGWIAPDSILSLLLDLCFGIALVMGEEIGWRGFLLPKMERLFGWGKAVVLGGLLWAVWHYPAIIAGVYEVSTPLWFHLPMFTLEAVLLTAVMALLRFGSKSLWPVILLHASHNYVNQMLGSLGGSSFDGYFAGEAGLLTVLFTLAIFLFLYKIKPLNLNTGSPAGDLKG